MEAQSSRLACTVMSTYLKIPMCCEEGGAASAYRVWDGKTLGGGRTGVEGWHDTATVRYVAAM